MLLLVGLGNPGERYADTRHNIGAMAVTEIVRRHGFSPWRRRFQGHTAEGRGGEARVLALLPGTFMNLSGQAVGEAVRFHKLSPAQVIVAHDDLDLAPGRVRVKTGGGHGGHNGLKSVDAHLGRDYRRLRLGIGHPGDRDRVTSYVLGPFAKADRTWLIPLLDAVAEAFPRLAAGDDSAFTSQVMQKAPPPAPPDTPEKEQR